MVFNENLTILKRHGRTHPTWTDELPFNVKCLDSRHAHMLRHQQWNGSRFLSTVSESATDIGDRTSVSWVFAALQVPSRVRREGTQEAPKERRHRYSHLPTIRHSAPVTVSL